MPHPDLQARAMALVDDKLIHAYWEAVAHYKTQDLVLIYAVGDARYPVRAFAREELLASTLPEDIKTQVAHAAVQAGSGEAAFWLLAIFSEEEAACLAVPAKPVAPAVRH